MRKTTALRLLGPTNADLARRVGVSGSAVSQWPEVLPPRLQDRVLAALARQHLPADLLAQINVEEAQPCGSQQGA